MLGAGAFDLGENGREDEFLKPRFGVGVYDFADNVADVSVMLR
jgi:hypothetical protein